MPYQRRLKYFVAASIDGFIAGPDGDDPSSWWPTTDDYIDFIRSEYPETLPGPVREALGVTGSGHHFDKVVEGRRSYEVGLAAGIPDAFPHLRHLVVSTSLASIPDGDVELVRDDPVHRIRELKSEPGKEPGKDIWLGVPLWGRETDFDKEIWTNTEVRPFPGGMTLLRFARSVGD